MTQLALFLWFVGGMTIAAAFYEWELFSLGIRRNLNRKDDLMDAIETLNASILRLEAARTNLLAKLPADQSPAIAAAITRVDAVSASIEAVTPPANVPVPTV